MSHICIKANAKGDHTYIMAYPNYIRISSVQKKQF